MERASILGCIAAITLVLSAPARAQLAAPAPGPSATVIGAPATETVFVPKGVKIVVKTIEGHSSYAAHAGEPIHYVVVDDVIVDGHIIARAGDDAEGVVEEGQQGRTGVYGFGYKAADLRVDVEAIHTFCGDTLHVLFDRTEYRRRQGLFGSNKDVQIVKGQNYVPVVAYPQKVCGVATTATPEPIPRGAIGTATR